MYTERIDGVIVRFLVIPIGLRMFSAWFGEFPSNFFVFMCDSLHSCEGSDGHGAVASVCCLSVCCFV